MSLSRRSYQPELLDAEDIPFADIEQNMRELNVINTWLGGHRITVNAFKKLLGKRKEISVCEIGCGGGDNLLAIERWCVSNGIRVQLTGIDLKPACIAFAEGRKEFANPVQWIASDYETAPLTSPPDVVFSSLFCHHFTNEQLVKQFRWMRDHCRIGFFINDLQRHPMAYHSIRLLTRLFSSSYLVKNDAPLSVARGFRASELQSLMNDAGLDSFTLQWKWAFRYALIYQHKFLSP